MKWSDPTVLVAVYAAVIGTTGLGWNIARSVIQSRSKVRVECVFNQSFESIPAIQYASDFLPVLTARITNIGKVDRSINNPAIQFTKRFTRLGVETDTLEAVSLRKQQIQFPLRLRPGDVFKKDMNADSLYSNIHNDIPDKEKFRILVSDTIGKKYYSAWHSVSKISDHIQLSQKVNAANK